MDITTFTDGYPQRFTKLDFGDFVLTDHEITDQKYQMQANIGDDFNPGTVASAEFDFTILSAPSALTNIAGREYSRYYGVEANKIALDFVLVNSVAFICAKNADAWKTATLHTNIESSGAWVKAQPSVRIYQNGAWSTVASPLLLAETQLWASSDGSNIYTYDSEQNIYMTPGYSGIQAFYSDGTYLYAYKPTAPYAYKFLMTDNTLVAQGEVTGLTALQIEQIQNLCSSKMSTAVLDTVQYDFYYDAPYFVQAEMAWHKFGVFTVDTATKPSNSPNIAVVSFDRMHKAQAADKLLAAFMDTQTFPSTTGALFSAACTYLGVSASPAAFTNSAFPVANAYNGDNAATTVSALFGWIAQLAGGFACANDDGLIEIRGYSDKTASIQTVNSGLRSNVFGYNASAYTVPLIDKVQLKSTDDDIGVIVGSGTNALIIKDNPLVTVTTDAEMRPYVQALYDKVSIIPAYRAVTLVINGNPFIQCGDILTVNNGTQDKVLVMSVVDEGNASINSRGQRQRSVPVTNVNQEVVRVRGAVTELTQTVDSFKVEVYNDYTKNSDVRTKFAADANSVEITSGAIAFKANTFTLDSDNCKISADGTITAKGSFRSANADGTWVNELSAGAVKLTHNGAQRAHLFQAGNYDAAYLVLDGQFGSGASAYSAQSFYASDGVSINKNGALVAGIGADGVSIKVPSAIDSTLTVSSTLTVGSTLVLGGQLKPRAGQNSLYCNWVSVKGTDGNNYWALCGKDSPW